MPDEPEAPGLVALLLLRDSRTAASHSSTASAGQAKPRSPTVALTNSLPTRPVLVHVVDHIRDEFAQ
jgi:hypothetical protein